MSISIIVPILLPTEALGGWGHTARGLQDLKAGICLRVPRSTVDHICTVLETTSVCMCGVSVSEFLGMILPVEFLRMGDFSTVGHLCAYIDAYGSDGIIHSLIVCMDVFMWLGNRLCFGWEGGTFVYDAEESATSIPTPLQNDSAGEAVDSKYIIFISQYSQNGI